MLKASELGQKHRCTKRRMHELFLKSEKNPMITKVVVCKDVLKRYLNGDIAAADVPTVLETEFDNVGYVDKNQKLENLSEMQFQLSRYVGAEENEVGIRTRLKPTPMVLNIFGTDVWTAPDAVFVVGNRIEVVKYQFKAPNVAQNGSTRDASVNNCLEIYALWKYGRSIAFSDDDVISAGYIFTGREKKHEADLDFGPLSPNNKLAYRMLTMQAGDEDVVDDIYKDIWQEFLIGSTCEEADCMFCEYQNACKYTPAPPAAPQKTSKSMSNLTLSPQQEAAISFTQGIGRIKAGAGAGKTLVVSLRVVSLLSAGYDPEKMLFITFTINGAEEMRQRIKFFCQDFGYSPEVTDKIRIMTFNSFGQLAIENEWPNLGYTECPQVIDSIRRKVMILAATEGYELPGVNYKNFEGLYGNGGFDTICQTFETMKFYGITAYNWKKFEEKLPAFVDDSWIEAYEKYCDALQKANLVEYADQQRLLEVILADNPYYIEDKYGFEHIIVDEFQDTSDQEIELLKKMVDSKTFVSLLVVGDDAQNIFESLRHTTVENIVNFDEKMGEPVTDFELMENYRSTPEIIDVANKINDGRVISLGGHLVSMRNSGAAVEVFAFESQKTEYRTVADKIQYKIDYESTKPEDIAFIAKDGNELKAMAAELTKRGIQSQFLTPESVIDNSRVVAALAAGEYLENDECTLAAFDYLNTVSDGQLFEKSDAEIQTEIDVLKEQTQAALQEHNKIDTYFDMLSKLDETDETYMSFRERLDQFNNWEDLLAYLRAFKRFGGKEKYRRKAYAGNGVVLTTVHSSKGLEWKYVYVSLTKFNAKASTPSAVEESRRILFTAVTRAKDELVITGVANKKGSSYIREVFVHVGKEFEVIPDDNDEEKMARKERAKKVKEKIAEAAPDKESLDARANKDDFWNANDDNIFA